MSKRKIIATDAHPCSDCIYVSDDGNLCRHFADPHTDKHGRCAWRETKTPTPNPETIDEIAPRLWQIYRDEKSDTSMGKDYLLDGYRATRWLAVAVEVVRMNKEAK